MKRLLFIFFVLCSINANCQTSAQLNINKINATINTIYRPLFHQVSGTFPAFSYQAGFEAPRGSGRHTIFASNLWIGGMDANDSIRLAASDWGPQHDFIPGPIMDSIHYSSQTSQWNRVWKINRSDILDFENWWITQSPPGFQIPADWLTWPAHGNTSMGQAQNLAPFYDRNNDGIYNVLDGDYPLVPGDQCIYFIFNDDTIHATSGGLKMKAEVHAFVYSFDCTIDSALQNTVFLRYKIFNRGTDLYNTRIGIFTDTDLGGTSDDYIGCNVSKGSFYSYNGDNHDDNYNGAMGYGDSLTAQSITFLAGPYQDFDGWDNPITPNISDAIDSLGIPYSGLGMNYGNGIVDDERIGMSGFTFFSSGNPLPMTYPNNYTEYYRYMSGLWLDNSNLVYGGNGHSTSADAIANGLVPTNYTFPGDTDPLNWGTKGVAVPSNWNEITAGNTPSDRNGMGWCGPFSFPSGTSQEIDIAFVFARDCIDTSSVFAPVELMNDRIDSVRNYFNLNQTPCGGGLFRHLLSNDEIQHEEVEFSLYPNPSSSQFTLSYSGDEKNLSYFIHDILGKEITSGKIISEQTEIDCSKWSKGIYLVKFGNENGISVKKVVVE